MSSRSPSGNPSHGGDSDPNETRRRKQHTQMVSNQPSTPTIDGGDIDPNEVHMQLAHNSPSQYSSPPDHGGNTDPNETRQRLGQTQSASPLLPNQAGISTTTRVVDSQQSTMQYSTPSPSPSLYGSNIHSSAGPSQPARLDQPPSQARSGYFQGPPILQPFGGPQVQHPQIPAAASPPPGVYGGPLPQIVSPLFPAQTHGPPNQQTNGYGGQPSQILHRPPPQVRTQAFLREKEADKARRATSSFQ